jgi:hypothetical protein
MFSIAGSRLPGSIRPTALEFLPLPDTRPRGEHGRAGHTTGLLRTPMRTSAVALANWFPCKSRRNQCPTASIVGSLVYVTSNGPMPAPSEPSLYDEPAQTL